MNFELDALLDEFCKLVGLADAHYVRLGGTIEIDGVAVSPLRRLSGLRLSTPMVVPGPPIQPAVGMLARTRMAPRSASTARACAITALERAGSLPK